MLLVSRSFGGAGSVFGFGFGPGPGRFGRLGLVRLIILGLGLWIPGISILLPPTFIDSLCYGNKVTISDVANELYRDIVLDCGQLRVIDPGLFVERMVRKHSARHGLEAQIPLTL